MSPTNNTIQSASLYFREGPSDKEYHAAIEPKDDGFIVTFALLDRGVVRIAMSLAEQVAAVRALFERYDNVPTSLADACLVRMSELYEPSRVLTLDSDFMIYRRHGRKVIPVLSPI